MSAPTKPAQLFGCAADGLTLKEAIEACLPAFESQETVALLYSARRCRLARMKDRQLCDEHDRAIKLDDVFEARIFNQQSELRWLNEQGGFGRAVLLSAREIPEPCREKLPQDASLVALHSLEQTYLLWGEGIDQANTGLVAGWSRLTTARIGKLDVPVTGVDDKENKRVHLKALEYLAEYDEHGNVVQDGNNVEEKYLHGNVAVVEERLLCLEVVK